MTAASTSEDPATRTSRGGVMLGSILLVLGVLVTFAGGVILTAGIIAASARSLQDEDGFFTTPTETFVMETSALTPPSVGDLTVGQGAARLPFDPATVRLRAAASDGEIFLGIGPRADVHRYLRGVERTEIRELRYVPFEVRYRDLPGEAPQALPGNQDFWAASASGTSTQTLEWSVTPGDWAVVVMNADGGAGITVDLQAGVRSDLIGQAVTAVLVLGGVLLLVGIPMLVIGAVTLGRSLSHRGPPPGGALVLVAGIALLFTARYPQGLFDLLVGISRWTFPVITYAALLRDEYPPFRLHQGPTDPAPLDMMPPDEVAPAGAALREPVMRGDGPGRLGRSGGVAVQARRIFSMAFPRASSSTSLSR